MKIEDYKIYATTLKFLIPVWKGIMRLWNRYVPKIKKNGNNFLNGRHGEKYPRQQCSGEYYWLSEAEQSCP